SSLSDEQNVTISILNSTEVPQLSNTTLWVDENLASGANVGTVIILTHGDSVISSFTMTGTDVNKFSINTSGVITTTTSLNYETKNEYNLSVKATNSVGDSSIVDLTINVTDIADVVPVLVDTSLSVREDAAVGSSVGSITIDTEGDAPITSTTLGGVGSANFELGNDGILSVKSGASFDYETTDEYNLTAQVTNSVGSSNTVNLFISVNNVIDEVPVIADSVGAIDENATLLSVVGTLSITYEGDSNITNISLSGTGSGYFSIANDGVLTLSSIDVLDFESAPTYILTATATNTAGDSNDANITITINDSPEVPILINTALSIMENEISGAVVGNIDIQTIGDRNITSIDLNGTGSSNFVSDVDGEITLTTNSSIDFETTPQYTLTAIATNARGVSLPVSVTIDIEDYAFDPTQIDRLDASDAELDDRFGSSVDISSDYMVIGAPNEDGGALSDGGSVYLYKKDITGISTQLTKITATTPKISEYFGYSVAIDSNVIVVGAPEGASASGDAYIYLIDANSSVSLPPQQINSGAPSNGDSFGSSVAISGNYILVGAPNNASAYLYKLDVNQTATLVDTITEVGLVAGDSYASSIAIDGNYILIGAKDKSVTSNSNGVVYFYEIDTASDTANLLGTQNLSAVVDYDYFGSSVSISGNYAVVGAHGIDTVATDAGMVYLYEITSGSPSTVAKVDEFAPNIAPDSLAVGDYFGYSLDISGEYIIAGAYKKDSGAISDAGSAYVYHIDTNTDLVDLVKKLDSLSPAIEDYFGASVAIDGDFMIVGIPNEDSNATNSGTVFVFDAEPSP
ncbi:MAG: cadherin domain-containing protein, partial [Thiovulaceae bacterium]|nr:cadherin domain-containing protein [Sulfurimonadaceae bacterium]